MDPVSLIVTALITGAAAGLQPTATNIIKDAYAGLKALIKRKYERVSVEVLENDPADKARQDIVKKDLERTNAAKDEELLHQAQIVLAAIEKYAPEAAGSVGVDLEDVKVGASVKIKDIIAGGSINLRAKGLDIKENFEIEGLRAGKGQKPEDPQIR
jgi:hypothetical protein